MILCNERSACLSNYTGNTAAWMTSNLFLEAVAGGSIEGDSSVQCRCQFPLHPPQSFFRVKEKDAERGSEFVDSNIRGTVRVIHTYLLF